MVIAKDKAHGQTTCAVEVSPSVVDAGAEMTLTGMVSCTPPCDLRGRTLSIKDHDGALAGSAELAEYNGETNVAAPLALKAPAKAGEYKWLVTCAKHVSEGVSYQEASALFSFTVKPHTASVIVWDIPYAVAVGDRMRITVGIKCSNQCQLTNLQFQIHDHEGAKIATGRLGSDPAPGTIAVYFAEIGLKAPEKLGLFEWTAKVLAGDFVPGKSEVALPHSEGSATFLVNVVNRPEYLVTVEAIDGDKQAPIKGAQVVMDPYRAVTDERGVAEVRVAKGPYKLYVFGPSYYRFERRVEVTGDMSTRAELYLQPPPERN